MDLIILKAPISAEEDCMFEREIIKAIQPTDEKPLWDELNWKVKAVIITLVTSVTCGVLLLLWMDLFG